MQRLRPDPAPNHRHRRERRVSTWAFDTVLVANRGEIARRVIRTARTLGLRTVAVYSAADQAAPHVREADEAVLLGPARPQDSYLNADAMLAAASPPGRGDPPGLRLPVRERGFARAVEGAASRSSARRRSNCEAFGDKHTARELARAAGVPMTAGTGLLATAEDAVAQAEADRLPGDGEGDRRRRWHRHAGLRRRGRGRRGVRPRAAAGGGELRRRRRVPRAAGRRPAMSRCRSSATAPGRSRCSATGTARCSAATRR